MPRYSTRCSLDLNQKVEQGEVRRNAANIAKLPDILQRWSSGGRGVNRQVAHHTDAVACMIYGRSMSKPVDYRAKAEYCREMAAKAMGPLDKEEWLQQATNWRTLASLSDRECRRAAAEMNDPTHKKQMEVMAEMWERLAAHLSIRIDNASNEGN
jgi:hypothetical protein